MAHIRQSRPDYGTYKTVKHLVSLLVLFFIGVQIACVGWYSPAH